MIPTETRKVFYLCYLERKLENNEASNHEFYFNVVVILPAFFAHCLQKNQVKPINLILFHHHVEFSFILKICIYSNFMSLISSKLFLVK